VRRELPAHLLATCNFTDSAIVAWYSTCVTYCCARPIRETPKVRFKYTPNGGTVEIAASENTSETIITVRDSGIGIAPYEIPRIWERLYRGAKSRAEHGLGLGLSLVKAVVQAHGGRADVESEPGKGSTFSVRFPPAAPI
jgi:light-regulated signal transduction histidine kinase (bacteriophytochrome)